VGNGEEIRQREFATVRRGYDPSQVRAYLASLAAHVDALERALADTRARLERLETAPPPPSVDPYEQLSKRFAGVLASADTEAEQIVRQAQSEADRIKAEARSSAEEARIRSSQSLMAAQQESDRLLADLAERREAMLGQLHEMQSRLLEVAGDLESAIQPSVAPPPPAVPSAEFSATPGLVPAAPDAPLPEPEPSAEPRPAEIVRVEDLRVARSPAAAVGDTGLAGLFDEPADEVDLPDLSDLDLDLDDEPQDEPEEDR
jgi:DivIVA domain-containing protein